MSASGIYRIRVARGEHPAKFYIGQAAVLRKRKTAHFRALRNGVHKNEPLQRAFRKYGESSFNFEILLICERRKDILDLYEQTILDSYPDEAIYNLCRECVGSRLGMTNSPAHIEKFGGANRGKVRSPEHREAVRQSNMRRIVSDETRAKMSEAHKGNKYALGHKQSEDHKRKVGAFFKGRKKSREEIVRRLATRAANRAAQ